MSTFVYGSLTKRRIDTPANKTLGFGAAAHDATESTPPDPTKDTVGHWQDAVAALVPAEVLALHATAMSFGTTTTGTGADSVTKITYPNQMMVVYVAMCVLAAALYFFGAKSVKKWQDWARAAIPVLAFVAWTMIQPSTAFDAFPFGLTSFARIMIAIFLAIALTTAANRLASQADKN